MGVAMDDECEVEIEVVELPSEHRVVRWDDGDHTIYKVYLKDGKPFQYDDDSELLHGLRVHESREELEAALLEIGAGIAHAISLPTLSEKDDFPGQQRPDWSTLPWKKGTSAGTTSTTYEFDDEGE